MSAPKAYWTGTPLLKMRLPWLTPKAIDALKKIVRPEFSVLEFGCGGSTLFFSDRVNNLVSWEDDPRWVGKIKGRIRRGARVTFIDGFTVISALPTVFDIVLVDTNDRSTDRNWIARNAVKLVRPGGWFILDNYGRYPTEYLRSWKYTRYDDPHWSGRGTLIAEKPAQN